MFCLTTHSTHFILQHTQHILFMFIKEGNVLFNDTLNTFYFTTHSTHFILRHTQHILFTVIKEGNVYLMTHSTHFIYGYMEGMECYI